MVHIIKVRQIGGCLGITLPAAVIKKTGLVKGDTMGIAVDPAGILTVVKMTPKEIIEQNYGNV